MAEAGESKPKRQSAWSNSSTARKVLAIGIWIVVIAVVAALIVGSSDEPSASKEATKSKFDASLGRYSVVDPATLGVEVNVKNTGEVSSTPECFVSVQNSSGTYKGSDMFNAPRELAPGEEASFVAQLVITKEGAAFVTEGYVTCE